MGKKAIITSVSGTLLLLYSGLAWYYTGGLRLYTISSTTGKLLVRSLPFTLGLGLVVLLAGVFLFTKWIKAKKANKPASVQTDVPAVSIPASDDTAIDPSAASSPADDAPAEPCCPSCGEKLTPSAKFCKKCGAKIIVEE